MRIRGWQALILGVVLTACTASPPRPAVPPQRAAVPPPRAAAAPQPAVVPPQEPGDSSAQDAELDRRARQKGYHTVVRNGTKLYCQYGEAVGSHISRMQCLNPQMMAQAVRDDDELQDKLSLRGNQLCPGCVSKEGKQR